IELIARSADKAWLDFRAFENEDHQASLYRSGEVCNAGTLCCKNCDNNITLSKSGQIPRCPICDRDEFFRIIG
ncbi:MAG: zinc ribbon-containing protein, partial [Gammaproteobacteria bacterium]|nr:zinc ribbon-containing protein [Gammaproteobacteria bacterium]